MKRIAEFLQLLPAIVVFALASAPSVAQTFPSKPVRVIVPFPPGGGGDRILRAVSDGVEERLGQKLVFDNRPGASGLIGGELGFRATPDAYTITLGTASNFSISPNMVPKAPYDPVLHFSPVTLVAQAPLMLAVHPSVPAKSTRELIALARSKPKALFYASNGKGSISHLTAELFGTIAKVEMVHVPYKGGTPAVTDTMAGHVSVIITAVPTLATQVRAGRLRALGVTGPKPVRLFPDVPSISQTGLPGFESVQWWGLFAPTKSPPDRIAKLNKAFVEVLRQPATAELLAKDGSEPVPMSPDEVLLFLKQDIEKWTSLIRTKGLRAD